jgi:glycopeptide antibiotics resistance protein
MLVNILLFLPVGMTLPMVFRRNEALITFLFGFGISLAFEISQFFSTIGGFAYIDLITNTLGTTLGVLLLYLIRKVVDDRLAVKILFVFQIIFAAIAIFGTVNTIINIDLYL